MLENSLSHSEQKVEVGAKSPSAVVGPLPNSFEPSSRKKSSEIEEEEFMHFSGVAPRPTNPPPKLKSRLEEE